MYVTCVLRMVCVRVLKVALADEAIRIGPAPALESYLKGETILEAARRSGAQARDWLLLIDDEETLSLKSTQDERVL